MALWNRKVRACTVKRGPHFALWRIRIGTGDRKPNCLMVLKYRQIVMVFGLAIGLQYFSSKIAKVACSFALTAVANVSIIKGKFGARPTQ